MMIIVENYYTMLVKVKYNKIKFVYKAPENFFYLIGRYVSILLLFYYRLIIILSIHILHWNMELSVRIPALYTK